MYFDYLKSVSGQRFRFAVDAVYSLVSYLERNINNLTISVFNFTEEQFRDIHGLRTHRELIVHTDISILDKHSRSSEVVLIHNVDKLKKEKPAAFKQLNAYIKRCQPEVRYTLDSLPEPVPHAYEPYPRMGDTIEDCLGYKLNITKVQPRLLPNPILSGMPIGTGQNADYNTILARHTPFYWYENNTVKIPAGAYLAHKPADDV